MNNNKGFTLVELIVSFVLTLFVVLFLTRIIVMLKNASALVTYRTEILTKQGIITDRINQDLETYAISSIEDCGSWCVKIVFVGGLEKELTFKAPDNTGNDKTENYIRYGNYAIKFPTGTTIEEPTIARSGPFTMESGKSNSIITINIPIRHKLYEDTKFDVRGIYQYDSRTMPTGTITNFN